MRVCRALLRLRVSRFWNTTYVLLLFLAIIIQQNRRFEGSSVSPFCVIFKKFLDFLSIPICFCPCPSLILGEGRSVAGRSPPTSLLRGCPACAAVPEGVRGSGS